MPQVQRILDTLTPWPTGLALAGGVFKRCSEITIAWSRAARFLHEWNFSARNRTSCAATIGPVCSSRPIHLDAGVAPNTHPFLAWEHDSARRKRIPPLTVGSQVLPPPRAVCCKRVPGFAVHDADAERVALARLKMRLRSALSIRGGKSQQPVGVGRSSVSMFSNESPRPDTGVSMPTRKRLGEVFCVPAHAAAGQFAKTHA